MKIFKLTTFALAAALTLSGCSQKQPSQTGTITETDPTTTSSATTIPTDAIIQPDESEAPTQDAINKGCEFATAYLTYNYDEPAQQRINRLTPYLATPNSISPFGPKIVRPERSTLPGYYAQSTATLENASYTYDANGKPQARCFISYDAQFGDATGNNYVDKAKNLWLVAITKDGHVTAIIEP